MGVVLNAVASLVPPLVFFARVTEEHVAWQLLAKAEGSRTLGLMFCAVEL